MTAFSMTFTCSLPSSPRSDSIRRDANIAGCRDLVAGRFPLALKHFSYALKEARRELQQQGTSSMELPMSESKPGYCSLRESSSSRRSDDHDTVAKPPITAGPPSGSQPSSYSYSHLPEVLPCPVDESDRINVFASPFADEMQDFQFCSASSDDNTTEDDFQRIDIAALFFNVALTKHLQYLHQRNAKIKDDFSDQLGCDILRNQAMFLYQSAWELVEVFAIGRASSEEVPPPEQEGGTLSFDLLVLAILNNKAALWLDLEKLHNAQDEIYLILNYSTRVSAHSYDASAHGVEESTRKSKKSRSGTDPKRRAISEIIMHVSTFLWSTIALTPWGTASAA